MTEPIIDNIYQLFREEKIKNRVLCRNPPPNPFNLNNSLWVAKAFANFRKVRYSILAPCIFVLWNLYSVFIKKGKASHEEIE